ncbi:MAG: DUF2889 domain-containing protein [Alphaproteobacteria bacterium]
MPLSPPVVREPIHRRMFHCEAFRRQDGMWDIEGSLIDTKSYTFTNKYRGEIKPGVPIHEMWLRLTISDDYVIRDVEAITDYSPFAICGNITPDYCKLIGEKIVPGFTARCRTLFGGVQGCTHITELLGRLATVTFQAIAPIKARAEAKTSDRPRILDTCHALAADGPIVRDEFAEFYTGHKDP